MPSGKRDTFHLYLFYPQKIFHIQPSPSNCPRFNCSGCFTVHTGHSHSQCLFPNQSMVRRTDFISDSLKLDKDPSNLSWSCGLAEMSQIEILPKEGGSKARFQVRTKSVC